jgi:hypothetical protein
MTSPGGNPQRGTDCPQGPGNQTPVQPATTSSSTTVASFPGSLPPSAPNASEHTDNPYREKEKDKGYLSTTLTGTHHTERRADSL